MNLHNMPRPCLQGQVSNNTLWWALTLILLMLPNCVQPCTFPGRCGNVSIPYPFSTEASCSYSSDFTLDCRSNLSLGPGQFPYFFSPDYYNLSNGVGTYYQVLDISYDSLILNISDFKASEAGAVTGDCVRGNSTFQVPPYPGPFVFSGENQFGLFNGATTCQTRGEFTTEWGVLSDGTEYTFTEGSIKYQFGGCYATCAPESDCTGTTCCATPMPGDTRLVFYFVSGSSLKCRAYSTPYYPDQFDIATNTFGVKILWALPYNTSNDTDVIKDLHVCSDYSNITYQSAIPGYVCACLPGFDGDGYSNGTGCKDIDECSSNQSRCDAHHSKCRNTPGNYTCTCQFGYQGDGISCRISTVLLVLSGVIGGSAVVCIAAIFLGLTWRQWQKRKNFALNGGLELLQIISSTGRETMKVFTIDELKSATQNFSDELKLGAGSYGTVFKGTLKSGNIVAIKKANRAGENDNKQFANEMAILSQINHRHIVRLLGCCLESETPLLVYEYISNGTLSDHLVYSEHPAGTAAVEMGWAKRLQIAIQTAEALAYLHSAASPPILHRDVKSANILMDDNMDAKVADFGVSRLIPEGETYVSTIVQGTLGYLDPEYFQTLQLTEKSDVYSVGVVLTELITGLKPVDNAREPKLVNLALLFISKMGEGRVEEIVDKRLRREVAGSDEEEVILMSSIEQVGQLALSCLALEGAHRPTMGEVVEELKWIRNSRELQQQGGLDESEPLLGAGGHPSWARRAGAVVMDAASSIADVVSIVSLGSGGAEVLRSGR